MRHFITKKLVEAIEAACEEVDLKFTTTYSGRAMYGRKCVGFVTGRHCDQGAFSAVFSTLRELERAAKYHDVMLLSEVNSLLDAIAEGPSNEDSMGLGCIIYFPNIEAAEEETEEEEE